MSRPPKLTDSDRAMISKMDDAGIEPKLIAERFGRSVYTINAILRGYKRDNNQRYDPPPQKVEAPRESRENSTIRLRGFTPEAAQPYIQRFGSHRVEVLP